MNKMLGNKKYILIFILPALVLFIGFTLIPLITSGIYSFFEYNGDWEQNIYRHKKLYTIIY